MTDLYRFYVGVEKNHINRDIPLHTREEALSKCRAFLVKRYGGYTEIHANGGYINKAFELVAENSVVFEVVGWDSDKARETAKTLKTIFDQESVLLVVLPAVSEFIQ